MPAISIFFGIVIRISYNDHDLPHFHAEYQASADNSIRRPGCSPEASKQELRGD